MWWILLSNQNGQAPLFGTFEYIMMGMLFISMVILIATLLIYYQKKNNQHELKVEKSKKDFLYASYLFFNKYRAIRSYLWNIEKRIETIELADKWTVSRKTMQFAYMSTSITVTLLLFFFAISDDLYFFLIGCLIIFIIHNQISKHFFEKMQFKIILQFKSFLEDVRHHYHEHGMIDEAIYDAIENAEYEISLHANKMYQILSAPDIEEEIDKYYDVVPNKFFKTFLALSYTVQKFGDKVVDKQSVFLTNLNYLKQEINMEVLKTEKLNQLFKSLAAIAILPVFAMKPIEGWAIKNLPEIASYYKGSYGFFVQLLIFTVVFLAYFMINKMQKDSEVQLNDFKFEDFLLSQPIISYVISVIINKNYSKAVKIMETLKNANNRLSVNQFYVRKLAMMVASFVIGVIVFQQAHALNREAILDSLGDSKIQLTTGKEERLKLINFDKAYLKENLKSRKTREMIKEDVRDAYPQWQNQAVIQTALRLFNKMTNYNNEYFKWWELLLCGLIACIAYVVPNIGLSYKKTMMELDMEDEVMQFHTTILMLMYIDQITVEDILQWMEQFALVFKDAINKCLNNFENGDMEALEELKIDEPFVPFARVVDNLLLASDKIPIVKAFDELRVERVYYQEKRKQDMEVIIMKKGIFGKMFAFAPLLLLAVLYLIVPFVTMSFSQLGGFYQNVQGVI